MGFSEAAVEMAYPGRAELAEGPVWHENALWWVDIVAGTLNRLDPASGLNQSRATGKMIGCAIPASDGWWITAREDGFHFLHWESGRSIPAGDPEADRPRNRFNDGKCGPDGRLLAGSLNLDGERRQCALYSLDVGGEIRKLHSPVSLSNGIDWSPDGGTLYHIDTLEGSLTAFSWRQGNLSNPRLVRKFEVSEGYPDGMAADSDGNLWLAMWGGGCVLCLDPASGKTLGRLGLPVSQASSCCFGGPDLKTLFITSAWQHLDAKSRGKEPLAGCIFKASPGAQGKPASRFGGKPRLTL